MRAYLSAVLVSAVGAALIACGGGPTEPTPTSSIQQVWACWDQGSAMDQAVGPDPHAPKSTDKQWHWCSDRDFKTAGWHRDSRAPAGWNP